MAIVSDEPGTTRDVVEVHLDLGGFAVIAMDTAGLRDGAGSVESEGIRRALRSADDADLRIWICDVSDHPEPGSACDGRREGDFLLWNKVDTKPEFPPESAENGGVFHISAKEERGIGVVLKSLEQKVRADLERPEALVQEFPGLTRARHRRELEDCSSALARLIQRTKSHTGTDSDLLAEDLRQAARSLGRLTGRVDVEEILDHIFRDFCIGK